MAMLSRDEFSKQYNQLKQSGYSSNDAVNKLSGNGSNTGTLSRDEFGKQYNQLKQSGYSSDEIVNMLLPSGSGSGQSNGGMNVYQTIGKANPTQPTEQEMAVKTKEASDTLKGERKQFWSDAAMMGTAGMIGQYSPEITQMGRDAWRRASQSKDKIAGAKTAYDDAKKKQEAAVRTNARRDELIQSLNNVGDMSLGPDYYLEQRKAALKELHEIDEQLGNAEHAYDASERIEKTVGGALKGYGGNITNAAGTAMDWLHENWDNEMYEGWEDNPYADYSSLPKGGKPLVTQEDVAPLKYGADKLQGTADKLTQESMREIGIAKADLSALGQAGVDLSVNLVQMGADAAGRAIGLGMLPFFTRAAGGAAQEARQAGANVNQQLEYGVTKGLIEVGTEKLFDGVAGIFGKGAADDVVESVVRKLARTDNGRTALRALAGASGEGTEEVISDLLDPFAKLIYNDQALKEAWENRKDLASDMLYDYLIGFAMGGLGAGGSIITGQDAAKNKALRDIDNAALDIDQQNAPNAQHTQEDTESRRAVNEALTSGRINNTTARQIAETPAFAKAFEGITGIKLTGTMHDKVTTIQRAARDRAQVMGQAAQAVAESTNALSEQSAQEAALEEAYQRTQNERRAQREAQERAAHEEAKARTRYGSYIRDTLRYGATVQDAKEIINNPVAKAAWEFATGKTLPDSNNKAVEMILNARENAITPAMQEIDSYVEQRAANNRTNRPLDDLDFILGLATQEEVKASKAAREQQEANNAAGSGNAFFDAVMDTVTGRPVPNASQAEQKNTAPAETAEAGETAQMIITGSDSRPSFLKKFKKIASSEPHTDVAAETRTTGFEESLPGKHVPDGGSVTDTISIPTSGQNVNRENEGRMRERGFAENVRTDAAMEEALRKDLEKNRVLYEQISNADTLAKAKDIFLKGFDTAYNSIMGAIANAKAGMKLAPEMVPLARMVSNELTRRGNLEAARQIASDIAAELSAAGQLGQAGRILRNADPATVLLTIEKAVEAINSEIQKKYGNRFKWRAELTQAEIDQIGRTDFSQEGAFEEVQQQIAERLGEEMPATVLEKLREMRKTFMLLNPKTLGKNVLGNVPLLGERKVAEKLSGAIQDLAVKAGIMSKENQTRTFKVGKEHRQLANSIYRDNISEINSKGSKAELRGTLRDQRVYFKEHKPSRVVNKFLNSQIDRVIEALPENVRAKVPEIELRGGLMETARRATYALLEAGDAPFVKSAFVDSLAEYCAAHNITESGAVSREAIDYATDQAMMATFKDASALAKVINSMKDNLGIVGEVIDIKLPFTTTPINIGKQYLKYSPFGYLELLTSRNRTGAEIADIVSRATTGSAVVALGALLRSLGWITGDEDDDEDKAAYDRAIGISPYSFAGKYSYEWAQPTGSALAMGASIYDATKDSKGFWDTIWDGIIAGGDVYLEQSFFKNIMEDFQGYGSPTEKFTKSTIRGILSQYIPAGVAAFARTTDPTVRSSYTGGDALSSALSSTASRIPWLSKSQPASVNVSGEASTRGNLWQRILDNYILPWNTNRNGRNASEVDELISNLYESTGKNNIFPQVSPYSIEYGGETYRLNGTDREAFQILQGQTYYEVAGELVGDKVFSRMSDTDKAKVLSEIASYSLDKAKQEFFGGRDIDYSGSDSGTWAKADEAMNAGLSFAEWEAARMKKSELDKSGQKATQKTQDFYQFLDDSGYSQKEKELLREQFGFYSQNRADPKQYDRLTASGFSTSEADRIFDIVSAVTPKEGESSVSNAQKAEAISDISGLNDGDKLRALEAYFAPDSSGKRQAIVRRYEAAMAAGLTFAAWTKCVSAMEEHSPSTKDQKIAVLEGVFSVPGQGRALYAIWNEPDADKYIEGVTDPMNEDYLGWLLGLYD